MSMSQTKIMISKPYSLSLQIYLHHKCLQHTHYTPSHTYEEVHFVSQGAHHLLGFTGHYGVSAGFPCNIYWKELSQWHRNPISLKEKDCICWHPIMPCKHLQCTAENTVSKSPTIFAVCIKKNFPNPVQKRALLSWVLGPGVSSFTQYTR